MAVTNYGNGWRKDVVNQCLEFANKNGNLCFLRCFQQNEIDLVLSVIRSCMRLGTVSTDGGGGAAKDSQLNSTEMVLMAGVRFSGQGYGCCLGRRL